MEITLNYEFSRTCYQHRRRQRSKGRPCSSGARARSCRAARGTGPPRAIEECIQARTLRRICPDNNEFSQLYF